MKNPTKSENLRGQLLQWMKLNRISWRELSRQTGIPASTLFGWLEEKRSIPFAHVETLIGVLESAKQAAISPTGVKSDEVRNLPSADAAESFAVTISVGAQKYSIVRVRFGRPTTIRARRADYRF